MIKRKWHAAGFILMMLILIPFFVSAQQKTIPGIVKVKAFYQIRLQGTQMVDENGQPVYLAADTIHFAVMELKGKQAPVIDSLFYFGKYYSCTVSGISNPKWNIGKRKKDGKDVAWQLQTTSSLWMIEFSPVNKSAFKKNALLLKGKINRKKFTASVSVEEELEAEIVQ